MFRKLIYLACVAALLLVVLFTLNGVMLSSGELPLEGRIRTAETNFAVTVTNRVRVMAFNLAKGFFYRGGMEFEKAETFKERLDQTAALIRQQKPDLVFLSEVLKESGPLRTDQVEYLAEHTDLPWWAFGENFNAGIPFFRAVGGNAILSRWEMHAVDNPPLPGRKPFYITKNNRRILWGKVEINEQEILLGSVHADSFDRVNNAVQIRELLETCKDQPAILAGDFNAEPGSESIKLMVDSGRFSGRVEGPPTISVEKPTRRIDYVFGPKDWTVAESTAISNRVSDHLAVLTVFELFLPGQKDVIESPVPAPGK